MYPLFETIRYKNGVAENLSLHQQRVDYTLMQLGASASLVLADQIAMIANKPNSDDKVYKCRLQYNLIGEVHIAFEPYEIKNIQTISIQDMGDHVYPFKYADRTWISKILANAGTDEVILSHKGFIKDASYANLVFFDGAKWVTPEQPLFMGTKRAGLLQKGIITEAPIEIKDLKRFTFFKLINAMMLWEESPVFTINNISN
jgi:4-amino-4-deoxychorismate lyase